MYKNKNRWIRVGGDEDDSTTAIDVDQVKNYVQQINKSTLNDLIKKVHTISLDTIQIKYYFSYNISKSASYKIIKY